ncbi:Calx-beta domain-containing protein [Allomuricauda sp. d1]|uniref:Calx-beta domain-containing protein n=1 Tax=Allomuricauda sp. d1 TaxID=3136725 RepID=UPI0031D79BFB
MGILQTNAQTVSISSLSDGDESNLVNPGQFNVSVFGLGSGTINVSYSVTGTATPGIDYNTLTGSVSVTYNGVGNALINVSVLDDNLIEGNETVIVTLENGIGYTVGAPNSATTSITDDDFAGMTLVPDPANLTTDESGSQDTFSTVLNAQPNSNVVIDIDASAGTGEGTVDVPQFVFTPANWNIVQTATVTGVNDDIDDGDQNYTIVLSINGSSDPNFLGIANEQVNVTNQDDDTAAIFINGSTDPSIDVTGETDENGDTASFEFTLGSQPIAPVSINLNESQLDDEGSLSINPVVLDDTNWDTGVILTVTGLPDSIVDGDQTYTIGTPAPVTTDPNYDALGGGDVAQIEVTNLDVDQFTVTIAATDNIAEEDGETEAEFTVSLDQTNNTGAPVTVNYTVGGTANSGSDFTPLSGSVNIPNGQIDNEIELEPIDDGLVENDETVILTIDSGSYDIGNPNSATATILDNDVAGFTINESGGSTATSEPSTTDSFTVVLDAQPSSNVVLNLSSSDTEEGTVTPATLTFTPGNFDNPRTITVTGVNDDIVDGPQPYTITVSINDSASDDAFDDVPDQTVNAVNADDDVAGFTIVESDGNTETSEPNVSDTFTVVLDAQPESNVVLNVSSSDTGEGTVAPGTVTFTPGNYDDPRTITVTGADDAIVDGPQPYSITVSVNPGSSDDAFDGVADQTVNVTNADNDVARLTISDAVIEEDGGSLNIIVQLDTEVTGGTTVTYSFIDNTATGGDDYDDSDDGEEIEFDGDEAGEVQIISIPIIDDAELENSENFFVQLGIPTNGVLLAGDGQATATILDDDNCLPSPILDTTQPTNFCDAIDVDLDDYISNAPPVGSVLTWSTLSDQSNTGAYLPDSQVNAPGTYFGFFRDTDEDCFSPAVQVTLVINTTPTVDETIGGDRCGEGTVTLTATASSGATLNWYDVATGGTILGTGSSFVTPSITETTSFYVEATANGCTSERVEVIATVEASPEFDAIACNITGVSGPTIIDLDEAAERQTLGMWSITTDPSDGQAAITMENTVDFEGLPSGTYIFEFTADDDTVACEQRFALLTIVVSDCNPDPIDLAILKEVDNAIPLLNQEINFTITLTNTSTDTAINITVGDLISPDDGFDYVTHVASDGEYVVETGVWSVDELLTGEAVTLQITVVVNRVGVLVNTAALIDSFPSDDNPNNNTSTATVDVDRSPCEDPGTLCNMFSPNGDGVNDLLVLNGHQDFPNNTLEVYDRYGNSVYSARGYDSSWDGTGNNGALPKGTYFYILDLGDGTEATKGWIQIIR